MSNCFANPLKNIWRGTSGNCFILHWKEKNDISKNGCGKFTQPICAFVYVCVCVPATALITLFYDFSTSLQICQQDSNKHSLGFWLWWTLHENYSPWSSLTSNKQTHRQRSSTAPRHNTFTNVSVTFFYICRISWNSWEISKWVYPISTSNYLTSPAILYTLSLFHNLTILSIQHSPNSHTCNPFTCNQP